MNIYSLFLPINMDPDQNLFHNHNHGAASCIVVLFDNMHN